MKSICAVCRRNALWGGIIVIPPGNFNTSNKDVLPNNDAFNLRGASFITNVSKVPLIKLWEVEGTFEYLTSGSTAKTIFVMFGPPNDCSDRIATWPKNSIRSNDQKCDLSSQRKQETGLYTLTKGTGISPKMLSSSSKIWFSRKETGFQAWKLATISWSGSVIESNNFSEKNI